MRRYISLAFLMCVSAWASAGAQRFDFGLGITPLSFIKGSDDSAIEEFYGTGGEDFFRDNVINLHAGATFAGIFYASVNANIMPPWWIKSATEYRNEQGALQQGIYAPGFITFVDVGVRPVLGSFILLAEAGLNFLYVHSAYTEGKELSKDAGVNMRVGAGWSFGGIDVMLTGSVVFANFDAMVSTLKGVAEQDRMAMDSIMKSMVPSLLVAIRF